MKGDNARPAVATTNRAQSTTHTENLSPKPIKKNTKLHRVLSALVERSYNRFEAASELHDHSLHSTVSRIQNTLGVRVDRRTETVRGYQGAPTHVCRYWIAESARDKALRVLGIER